MKRKFGKELRIEVIVSHRYSRIKSYLCNPCNLWLNINLSETPMKAILLLLLTILPVTTLAQQKRTTPAKPQPKATPAPSPAPTFDTLLPADSYTLYAEVRGAGQLIRANSVNELLEPVLKLAGPPKEFKSAVKWLKAHADELMTSRLLVAAWPTKKDLPQ